MEVLVGLPAAEAPPLAPEPEVPPLAPESEAPPLAPEPEAPPLVPDVPLLLLPVAPLMPLPEVPAEPLAGASALAPELPLAPPLVPDAPLLLLPVAPLMPLPEVPAELLAGASPLAPELPLAPAAPPAPAELAAALELFLAFDVLFFAFFFVAFFSDAASLPEAPVALDAPEVDSPVDDDFPCAICFAWLSTAAALAGSVLSLTPVEELWAAAIPANDINEINNAKETFFMLTSE